jgi:hypothetical protein
MPFANPRLMAWTGGSDPAHADLAVMGLQRLDTLARMPVPTVLSYALINPPSGAAIDSNGIITWIPTGAQLGTHTLTTVVTDNGVPPLSATNSFAVVVSPPPGPVLPDQAPRSVQVLTTLVVTNTATDGSLTVSQTGTNTIPFNYANRAALLADGWSFIGANGRSTEIMAGAGMVDYNQALHPGVLNLPCDVGDLWQSDNNSPNTLFRSLPADWHSVRLALTFAPVAANYQQAHLGLYQDDDNYLQMGVAYNSWDTDGHLRFTLDLETGGTPTTLAKTPTTITNLFFRIDRDSTNSTVACYYSFDGSIWTLFGTVNLTLMNPHLMIWTGGCDPASPANFDVAVMSLQRLDIDAGTMQTGLNYSLINPPLGATIDANGIITWTPSSLGTYTITTLAIDNGVPPLSATNSFSVTVVSPPQPPTLRTITLDNQRFVISWDAQPSQLYRLQYCDSLDSTNWQDIAPDVSATGTTLTLTNVLNASRARFFRVLLLP